MKDAAAPGGTGLPSGAEGSPASDGAQGAESFEGANDATAGVPAAQPKGEAGIPHWRVKELVQKASEKALAQVQEQHQALRQELAAEKAARSAQQAEWDRIRGAFAPPAEPEVEPWRQNDPLAPELRALQDQFKTVPEQLAAVKAWQDQQDTQRAQAQLGQQIAGALKAQGVPINDFTMRQAVILLQEQEKATGNIDVAGVTRNIGAQFKAIVDKAVADRAPRPFNLNAPAAAIPSDAKMPRTREEGRAWIEAQGRGR